jgi:hypothetical protein
MLSIRSLLCDLGCRPCSGVTGDERMDSISRWRAAVVPASTSEHAPDWSKNGFRSDAGSSVVVLVDR